MMKKTGIASIDADTEKLEKLEARSAKAKGLVGKLFSLPHADGSAIYTVEEEKGQKVRIVNQPIHDAWQDDVLGAGGWFPRKQIEPIIRRQEAFSKAMDNAAKAQKSERASYADIVGNIALAHLGKKADVYDLASWAWNRSRRGTVKEGRIQKNGQTPWANDIASALADSKLFPALDAVDPVIFIMLADKFSDPIIYRNAPPADDYVRSSVGAAFGQALGIPAPENIKIQRSDSKYLDNTVLEVIGHAGTKIASVVYDAATGQILRVNVGFQVDSEKGVSSE